MCVRVCVHGDNTPGQPSIKNINNKLLLRGSLLYKYSSFFWCHILMRLLQPAGFMLNIVFVLDFFLSFNKRLSMLEEYFQKLLWAKYLPLKVSSI